MKSLLYYQTCYTGVRQFFGKPVNTKDTKYTKGGRIYNFAIFFPFVTFVYFVFKKIFLQKPQDSDAQDNCLAALGTKMVGLCLHTIGLIQFAGGPEHCSYRLDRS